MIEVKSKLPALRAALDEALAKVAKEHGLASFRSAQCTYDPNGCFTFKVEGVLDGGLSKDAVIYNQCRQFDEDLPPLGSKFKHRSGEDEIIGASSTGAKILTKRSDGKQYWWKADSLKSLLQRQGLLSKKAVAA